MTALEILKAARELLSDESRWTKEASARTIAGEETDALSRKAVCWCMDGAIEKAMGGWSSCRDEYSKAADALAASTHDGIGVLHRDEFVLFNDDPKTTHADMLAAFDRAIAALEAEP